MSIEDEAEARIAKEFERELAACDALEAFALAHLGPPWTGRPIDAGADAILAAEVARGTKTYRASIREARKGYAEQAAMLNRSLFEGMAVAHWVADNPADAAKRFEDALRFDEVLTFEVVEDLGWLEGEDVRRPEMDADERARLAGMFGKHGERPWTGHRNLRELVDSIEHLWPEGRARKELREFLDMPHWDNNKLLHSSAAGLSRMVSRENADGLNLWVGASNVHVGQALLGANWSYIHLFALAMDTFDMADRDELDRLQKEATIAFHRLTPEETKGVGRNDPCPCGSGKKFKKCHGA